jgi:hypothetical protein
VNREHVAVDVREADVGAEVAFKRIAKMAWAVDLR